MAAKTLAPLLLCLASASVAPVLQGWGAAATEASDAEAMAKVLLQVQLDIRPRRARQSDNATGARPPFWAGKNGDAMRTGASAFVAPSNLEAGPSWSWHEPRHFTNGLVRAVPLIDADLNIYLASIAGGIYKFSPNGTRLWSVHSPSEVPEVPALLDGRLFATTSKGVVFALDCESGAELWHTKVSDASADDTWSVTAAEGVVVVTVKSTLLSENNDWLVALAADNGRELWRFRADCYNLLSAVRDGRLFFSTSKGTANALRLADGAVLWRRRGVTGDEHPEFTTGGTIMGPDGTLFVTSNVRRSLHANITGRVRALRSEDGQLLWSRDLPYEANNAAAVGRLSTSANLSVVVGIGENPDMPLWPGQPQPGVPKVGQVVALDAATGELRWSHQLPTWHDSAAGDTRIPPHVCLPDSFSNPAIGGDGTIYIGFEDGHLYALREVGEHGTPLEVKVTSFDAKAAFQGSVGIAPGMLVATPCDGLLVWRS